ncbi:MAG TPA: helix-hairpin-helix domain-containing protein [Candidatus Acidoferrum sp.]|nr:helix-hairpin-helix domain-containing protein [Candidatus Acidoferrum sp.]
MRSDYALYAVAVIFFAITIISFVVLSELERNLSVVATVVLGLLFVGLGYTQRPRMTVETSQAPAPLPAVSPPPTLAETVEAASQQKTEVNVEPAPVKTEVVKLELTAVKGVKEKRAEQLRALGIHSVDDLANASAKDLAEKLKISAYFTEQWIGNAKELLARS